MKQESGVQVRGATAHFDAVVSGATSGVLNAGLDSGVPVIFCVMTTDTMEQVTHPFILDIVNTCLDKASKCTGALTLIGSRLLL